MSARNIVERCTDSVTLLGICAAILVTFAVFARTDYRLAALNGHSYRLEVADTDALRAAGLGNRSSLSADQGMLFNYSTPAMRCFWMKDMRFPIDMIWLDRTKKATYIERDVNPSTYPQTFCHAGVYVIELNSGEAARAGLEVGQPVTF